MSQDDENIEASRVRRGTVRGAGAANTGAQRRPNPDGVYRPGADLSQGDGGAYGPHEDNRRLTALGDTSHLSTERGPDGRAFLVDTSRGIRNRPTFESVRTPMGPILTTEARVAADMKQALRAGQSTVSLDPQFSTSVHTPNVPLQYGPGVLRTVLTEAQAGVLSNQTQSTRMGISSLATTGGRSTYGHEGSRPQAGSPSSMFSVQQRGADGQHTVVDTSDYYRGGSDSHTGMAGGDRPVAHSAWPLAASGVGGDPTGVANDEASRRQRDSFGLLQRRQADAPSNPVAAEAAKARLFLGLDAPLYTGVSMHKKPMKFRIAPPTDPTAEAALKGRGFDAADPSLTADPPASEAFPEKNVYLPNQQEKEAYYASIKTAHTAHFDKLQKPTKLGTMLDNIVTGAGFQRPTVGTTSVSPFPAGGRVPLPTGYAAPGGGATGFTDERNRAAPLGAYERGDDATPGVHQATYVEPSPLAAVRSPMPQGLRGTVFPEAAAWDATVEHPGAPGYERKVRGAVPVIPEEAQSSELSQRFEDAGMAIARSTLAGAGGSHELLPMMQLAQSVGQRYGVQGADYVGMVSDFSRDLTDRFGGFRGLLDKALVGGVMTAEEAGPFAQGTPSSSSWDSTGEQGHSNAQRLGEFVTTRLLLSGKLSEFVGADPSIDAEKLAKLNEVVAPKLQHLEAARAVTKIGAHDKAEGATVDGNDSRGEIGISGFGGEDAFAAGNHVSAPSDADNDQTRLVNQTDRELGAALSNLGSALEVAQRQSQGRDITHAGVAVFNHSTGRVEAGPRVSDFFRIPAMATQEADSAVNSAMGGVTDTPSADLVMREFRRINGEDAAMSRQQAEKTAKLIGRGRRTSAYRLHDYGTAGDVSEVESAQYHNFTLDEDPSTAQDDIGARSEQSIFQRYGSSGDFQADPLSLALRHTGLAEGIPLNRKEEALYAGRTHEPLSLTQIGQMLTKSRYTHSDRTDVNRNAQRVYTFGDHVSDILTMNHSEAPIFTEMDVAGVGVGAGPTKYRKTLPKYTAADLSYLDTMPARAEGTTDAQWEAQQGSTSAGYEANVLAHVKNLASGKSQAFGTDDAELRKMIVGVGSGAIDHDAKAKPDQRSTLRGALGHVQGIGLWQDNVGARASDSEVSGMYLGGLRRAVEDRRDALSPSFYAALQRRMGKEGATVDNVVGRLLTGRARRGRTGELMPNGDPYSGRDQQRIFEDVVKQASVYGRQVQAEHVAASGSVTTYDDVVYGRTKTAVVQERATVLARKDLEAQLVGKTAREQAMLTGNRGAKYGPLSEDKDMVYGPRMATDAEIYGTRNVPLQGVLRATGERGLADDAAYASRAAGAPDRRSTFRESFSGALAAEYKDAKYAEVERSRPKTSLDASSRYRSQVTKADLDRADQVPADQRWMAEALGVVGEGRKGIVSGRQRLDPKRRDRLYDFMRSQGQDPSMFDGMGHGQISKYLKTALTMGAIQRSSSNSFDQFVDDHGNLSHTTHENFDIYKHLRGVSNQNAFIAGIGNPKGSVRDRTRGGYNFVQQLGLSLDPASVSQERIEGVADGRLGRGEGFKDADFPDARKVSLPEFISGKNQDLIRLRAGQRGVRGEIFGRKAADGTWDRTGADSYIAGKQMREDRLAAASARRALPRAFMKAEGISQAGSDADRDRVDIELEKLETKMGRKKVDAGVAERHANLTAVQDYWKARSRGQDAAAISHEQRAKIRELEPMIAQGQKVMSFFNAPLVDSHDDTAKVIARARHSERQQQMGEYIDANASLLAQRDAAGRPIAYDRDNAGTYSVAHIRNAFRESLEGGTVQDAIARTSALIDDHDRFREQAAQRDGNPLLTRDSVARTASILDARTDFLPISFDPATVRNATDRSSFVYAKGAGDYPTQAAAVEGAALTGIGETGIMADSSGVAHRKSAEQMYIEYAGRALSKHDPARADLDQLSVIRASHDGYTSVDSGAGGGKTEMALGFTAKTLWETRKEEEATGTPSDTNFIIRTFAKSAAVDIERKLDAKMAKYDRDRVDVKTLDADAMNILEGSMAFRRDALTQHTGIDGWADQSAKVDGQSQSPKTASKLNRIVSEDSLYAHLGDAYRNAGGDTKNILGGSYKSLWEDHIVPLMRDQEMIGSEALRALPQDATAEHQLAARTMESMHRGYAATGSADPLFAAIAATRMLNNDDVMRKEMRVDQTVGVVDEAEDVTNAHARFISARFGKGLMAIGDAGQNTGLGWRGTALNFKQTLGNLWGGRSQGNTTINPELALTRSYRQGPAGTEAANAILGKSITGNPDLEGVLAYTPHDTRAKEIAAQADHIAKMWFDPAMHDKFTDPNNSKATIGVFAPNHVNSENDPIDERMGEALTARGVPWADAKNAGNDVVTLDTVEGVRGRTFGTAFGFGFGEDGGQRPGTMNQLTFKNAPIASPGQIAQALASGDIAGALSGAKDTARKAMDRMKTAFTGYIGLTRSNTTILTGTGAPSRIIQPALDALRGRRGEALPEKNYTVAEAVPMGRGADDAAFDPAMLHAITEQGMRLSAETGSEAALTKDIHHLIPADMQLAKGIEPLMAERARQHLVRGHEDQHGSAAGAVDDNTGAHVRDFVSNLGAPLMHDVAGTGELTQMPQVRMNWEQVQRVMAGDMTALVGTKRQGAILDKEGELKRKDDGSVIDYGHREIALIDHARGIKTPRATGIVLNFGDRAEQTAFQALAGEHSLSDDELRRTGLTRDQLGAELAATHPMSRLNDQGVPTAFRGQQEFARGDHPTKADVGYLNKFSVAAMPDHLRAASVNPIAVDAQSRYASEDNPNGARYGVPAMPAQSARYVERDGKLYDARQLVSGTADDKRNPWASRVSRIVGKTRERVAYGGSFSATSDRAAYDAHMAAGGTGFDLEGQDWADAKITDKAAELAAVNGTSRAGLAGQHLAQTLRRGGAHDFFEGIGSALSDNQHAMAYVPDAGMSQALNMGARHLGISNTVTALSERAQSMYDSVMTRKDAKGTVTPSSYAKALTEGARTSVTRGVNAGDDDYVLSVMSPSDGMTPQSQAAAKRAMTRTMLQRQAQAKEDGKQFVVRTGGESGLDLHAAAQAQSMGAKLQMMLPMGVDDYVKDRRLSIRDQAQLRKSMEYAQSTGGLHINDATIQRDKRTKEAIITAQTRAKLDAGQSGMLLAQGGRLADEVLTSWDGAEKTAQGYGRRQVRGLQAAETLRIPVSNVRGDVTARAGSLSDEALTPMMLTAATSRTVEEHRNVQENGKTRKISKDNQQIARLPDQASISNVAFDTRMALSGQEARDQVAAERRQRPDKHAGLAAAAAAADAATVAAAAPPAAPPSSVDRPAVNEEMQQFIRQAASMAPGIDKLAHGGVHLVGDDEALAEAKRQFGDKANAPLRGWADIETGAVYVRDITKDAKDQNAAMAAMAQTTLHEVGHLATEQAIARPKGAERFQAAHEALNAGDSQRYNPAYKDERRTKEAMADLFAQGVGVMPGGGQAYLEHDPAASINDQFGIAGAALLAGSDAGMAVGGLFRGQGRQDERRGNAKMPKVNTISEDPSDIVARVRGTKVNEAITGARPERSATSYAQTGGQSLPPLTPRSRSDGHTPLINTGAYDFDAPDSKFTQERALEKAQKHFGASYSHIAGLLNAGYSSADIASSAEIPKHIGPNLAHPLVEAMRQSAVAAQPASSHDPWDDVPPLDDDGSHSYSEYGNAPSHDASDFGAPGPAHDDEYANIAMHAQQQMAARNAAVDPYDAVAKRLHAGLSADQNAIIDEPQDARVAVRAPAGSGKTRVLTAKVASLLGDTGNGNNTAPMEPEDISMVTFSTRGVGEFRKAIEKQFGGVLGKDTARRMNIVSGNALAQRMIRASDPDDLKEVMGQGFDAQSFKVLSSTNRPARGNRGAHPGDDTMLMLDAMGQNPMDAGTHAEFAELAQKAYGFGKTKKESPDVHMARYFKDAANAMVMNGQFGSERVAELESLQASGGTVSDHDMTVARMAASYHAEQGKRNVLGQEESMLLANRAAARPANAGMLDRFRAMFKHTIVDEAQDMSKSGAQLINTLSNGRGLTAAGDERQAIFGWRGGVANFMGQFGLTKSHTMRENYRSGQGILNFVNKAFGTDVVGVGPDKDGGDVSTHFTQASKQGTAYSKMRGGVVPAWQIEQDRMTHDMLGDIAANPGSEKSTLFSVPTHERLTAAMDLNDEHSPASRLKAQGIDMIVRKTDDELQQQAMHALKLNAIPEDSRDKNHATFTAHVKKLREEDQAREGVEASLTGATKGGEWDHAVVGGMLGEGQGQIINGALARKLDGTNGNDADVQAEYENQKNLGYVGTTRGKKSMRLYGSGSAPSRIFADAIDALGTSPELSRPTVSGSGAGTASPAPHLNAADQALANAQSQHAAGSSAAAPIAMAAPQGVPLPPPLVAPGGSVAPGAHLGASGATGTQVPQGSTHAPSASAPAIAGGTPQAIPVTVVNGAQLGASIAQAMPQAQPSAPAPVSPTPAVSHAQAQAPVSGGGGATSTPAHQSAPVAPVAAHMPPPPPSMAGTAGTSAGATPPAPPTPPASGVQSGGSSGGSGGHGGGTSATSRLASQEGIENITRAASATVKAVAESAQTNRTVGSDFMFNTAKTASRMPVPIDREAFRQQILDASGAGDDKSYGISPIDIAKATTFLPWDKTQSPDANSRRLVYEATQMSGFAQMADVPLADVAPDIVALGNAFGTPGSVQANALHAATTATASLQTDQEALTSMLMASPFLKRDDPKSWGDAFAIGDVLKSASVTSDEAKKGTIEEGALTMLRSGIEPKDVHTAIRWKDAQDKILQDQALTKGLAPLTQNQLDMSFTNQQYWQFQQETRQMQGNNDMAAVQNQQYKIANGLDAAGNSRLYADSGFQTLVRGGGSVRDGVMAAPASILSTDQLDFRIKDRNLQLETRNLERQSKILGLDEQLTHTQYDIQAKQLSFQGAQLGFQSEQLGIKQQQFGLKKESNVLELRSDALDLALLKTKSASAPEMSKLQMESAQISFGAQKRELDIQKREMPWQLKQAAVDVKSAELSYTQRSESVAFQRWYDTQMYGTVGTDRSGRAEFAMQGAALNTGRNGFTQDANTNKANAQIAATPVQGLANEQFYSGIQHQMSQLQLGRSSFRSDAAYNENVKYLAKQTDMYERRMKVEDAARAFGYKQTDAQLTIAKEQYAITKAMLALQMERLGGKVADAAKQIPIEERLLELNHLIDMAQLAQLPERIAIEIAKLGLKGAGMKLDEQAMQLSIEQEKKTIAMQQELLASQLATMELEREKADLALAARADELAIQEQNLADQKTIEEKQAEILALKVTESETQAKLNADLLALSLLLMNARKVWADPNGGVGTNNGRAIPIIDMMTQLAAKYQGMSSADRQAGLGTMSTKLADPSMRVFVNSLMDGSFYDTSSTASRAIEEAKARGDENSANILNDKAVVATQLDDSRAAYGMSAFDDQQKIAIAARGEIEANMKATNVAVQGFTDIAAKAGAAFNSMTGGVQAMIAPFSGPVDFIGNVLGWAAAVKLLGGSFSISGATGGVATAATNAAAGISALGVATSVLAAMNFVAVADGIYELWNAFSNGGKIGDGVFGTAAKTVQSWFVGNDGTKFSNGLSSTDNAFLTEYNKDHALSFKDQLGLSSTSATSKTTAALGGITPEQATRNYFNTFVKDAGVQKAYADYAMKNPMAPDKVPDAMLPPKIDPQEQKKVTDGWLSFLADGAQLPSDINKDLVKDKAKVTVGWTSFLKTSALLPSDINKDLVKDKANVTAGWTSFLKTSALLPASLTKDADVHKKTATSSALAFWSGMSGWFTSNTKSKPADAAGTAVTKFWKGVADWFNDKQPQPPEGSRGNVKYDIGIPEVHADVVAKIHKGETVLNTSDAAAYRAAKADAVRGRTDPAVDTAIGELMNFVRRATPSASRDAALLPAATGSAQSSRNGDTHHYTISIPITVGNEMSSDTLQKIKAEMIDGIATAIEKLKKR